MSSQRSRIGDLSDQVEALLAKARHVEDRDKTGRFDHDAYRAAFEAELESVGREALQARVEQIVDKPFSST